MEQMNMTVAVMSNIILITVMLKFFLSKRVKNNETNIYKYLLVSSLIESIIGIVLFFVVGDNLIAEIINKLYIISMAVWIYIFTLYVVRISESDYTYSISKKILSIILLLCFVGVVLLPIKILTTENNQFYSDGSSVYAVYFFSAMCLLWIFIIMFKNLKKIFSKKYIPVVFLMILSIIVMIVQSIYPEIFLFTPTELFVVFLMFFTIENPDAKLVEYEKTEKERAEAASLAKSEFLSSMSHELRTPLNAIVGLSEDIESFNDKVPKEVKEDTVDIVNASNTLLEIIGSILDISKIESGKLDIVESDYAPKEEFESIAKILRTKASEKNLEFNVSISERIPDVLFGDRLRIKQIINNLLSNAIKYTDHGRVNFFVNWLDASGALSITVADTGRGVKPEDIDKLFSKYDRLGVEKSSNVQGTGLGLAITKTLIDLMGGNVQVKSEYLIGTTFSVTIPQKLGDAERLEALKLEQVYIPKDLDFKGKKLLVVDDNLLNIKVFKKAVKDFHFEIEECYNGKEALDKIEMNNDYDIIFMDILMPIMGGEEAIGHLTNMPNFKTPVVALTADAMTGANNKYIKMGFSDYMSKPFSRKVIARKLDAILNKGEIANKEINHDVNVDENTSVNININLNVNEKEDTKK